MKRVIAHWTAGGYKASSLDLKHYHHVVEGDGNIVRGNHDISDNESTKNGDYAAHTRSLNTGSIGISMACMAGAKESGDYGKYPMTAAQFDAMCRKIAEYCRDYGIEVTPQTVLSHAEVQGTLGVKQAGKWDFTVLPFNGFKGAKKCGDHMRWKVKQYLAGDVEPSEVVAPAPKPAAPPKEMEEVVDDADKPIYKSKTAVAGTLSAAPAVIGAAVDLPESVLIILALFGVVVGGFIVWDRWGKAKMARKAKAAARA